ncbi:LysR family transcriptional regulator [Virgibacillus sp. Bac330]|uniref:LysR family transcriptional regulator n=1 Tax=Virgibacillus sp. Bac330 TaxID=2419841 RepID=UPI000EF4EC0A|nr:LysR family transcriptional regulator [Virgibacillus sp. Bac330]
MDIRQVEYFIAVANKQNFTKAASTLHISQPSLSKAIKNLENQLGVTLFYRGGKKIELTDAGAAFLGNAKQFIEAYENLTTEMYDVVQLKKGQIKIGIPPIIGATFFSKLISQYKAAHPSFHIELNEVGSNLIQHGVKEGELDVGLICNLPVEKHHFSTINLLKDPLMVVVQNNHPLASKKSVALPDLQDEPFILYQQDFSLHDRIIEACQQYDFMPNAVCKSSQRDFMIEMVEANLGIALFPSKICKQLLHHDVQAIPFKQPRLHLELALIWKKDKYLPYAVREFVTMAKDFTN